MRPNGTRRAGISPLLLALSSLQACAGPASPADAKAQPTTGAQPSTSVSAAAAAPSVLATTSPIAPSGPATVVQVFARGLRACALYDDGAAQCWGGWNFNGELGAGDAVTRKTPVWVVGLQGATSLTLAASRTCAITKAQELLCWGRPLPDPGASRTPVSRPVKVEGIKAAVATALGDNHACAVEDSGEVRCWGSNDKGQLGIGKGVTASATPVKVEGLPPAAEILADSNGTVARTRDGRLFIWGHAGTETSAWSFSAPHEVAGLSGVKRVFMARDHVCALTTAAEVRCFVHETLASFEAGKQHDFTDEMKAFTDALTKNSKAKRSARKGKRKLVGGWLFPDGRGLSDAIDLVVFNQDATAITKAGDVYSWGDPGSGTAGHPPDSVGMVGPTKIEGVTDAVGVAGGFMHRCVLDREGVVRCFGEGQSGTLGTAERRDVVEATVVEGLPKILSIASNDYCVFALAEDRTLHAWGRSWVNACGIEETENATPGPVHVPLLPQSAR